MIIKLPKDLATEIRARAEQQGQDPEAYTIGLLWRAIVEPDPLKPKGKTKKSKKTPVASVVSDHDWTEFFRFAEPSEQPPTPEQLSAPVKVSDE